MDTVLSHHSVSVTDLKRNYASILAQADDEPVAVLNHNRPAFYMITPKLFEALVEELADRDLVELTRQRLTTADQAIEVDLDQL